MNAYDICQRNVVTVRGHEDLATATWMMRERHVGCVVVVEPLGGQGGWRPIGVLSDRDIVVKVIAQEADPRNVVVADVMSPAMPLIRSARIEDALQRMRRLGTRRLPLVDERGRLCGILAFDDIFEHLSRRHPSPVVPLRSGWQTPCADGAPVQPGSMGTERI